MTEDYPIFIVDWVGLIPDRETFRIAFQTFWEEWKQQRKDYKDMSRWWEVGKLYFKMLATQYCAQMQKKHT